MRGAQTEVQGMKFLFSVVGVAAFAVASGAGEMHGRGGDTGKERAPSSHPAVAHRHDWSRDLGRVAQPRWYGPTHGGYHRGYAGPGHSSFYGPGNYAPRYSYGRGHYGP